MMVAGALFWSINFGALVIQFCNADYMKDENVVAKYWT